MGYKTGNEVVQGQVNFGHPKSSSLPFSGFVKTYVLSCLICKALRVFGVFLLPFPVSP
jgi:hypothetical protein